MSHLLRLLLGPGLAALLLPVGCAHHAPRTEPLIVLPLNAVGMERDEVSQMRATIARKIAEVSTTRVVDGEVVDRALPSQCRLPLPRRAWVECATRLGRALHAGYSVVGAMGGLNTTYVLHLLLVEVERGAAVRSIEETLFGAGAQKEAAVGQIARRLLNVRPPPWYKLWWLWTGVGAAVATAVVLPLALLRTDRYRDIPVP